MFAGKNFWGVKLSCSPINEDNDSLVSTPFSSMWGEKSTPYSPIEVRLSSLQLLKIVLQEMDALQTVPRLWVLADRYTPCK